MTCRFNESDQSKQFSEGAWAPPVQTTCELWSGLKYSEVEIQLPSPLPTYPALLCRVIHLV